ncbi:MAG TPA: VOC family protein [Burkholderiaceae bacterium]|nr:VOC family protein [Burkholderiaceae bacterium]
MSSDFTERESPADPPNPIGLDGIEYVEFATARPQALGQVLETIGFKPVARHRSREVLLYRQGPMNLVVNASPGALRGATPDDPPRISAIALRVRDARAAFERALERGAWEVPTHAEVMELHIPGIRGPGGSHIYFVDRYRDFSIYDVDFTLIPTVDPRPPAIAGMHFFGVVQYVGMGRTDDWIEFYRELLDFSRLPDDERFGILPKGTLLRSACRQFYLQLIEPAPSALISDDEMFQRIGLGTEDVLAAVGELRRHGVEFLETPATHTEDRGALTRPALGSVMFELVRDRRR